MLISAKRERLTELDLLAAERAACPPSFRTADPDSPTIWNQTQAWAVDVRSVSDGDIVRHARSALEATDAGDGAPKAGLEKVTEVLAGGAGTEPGRMARWTVATSNPAYERAFAKLVADPTRGHLEWTTVEQAAYAAVADLSRAMSLTDANGGFMVPFTLDPSILLTNDGSNNPLRQLATIKLTTTDTWNGVTSAGAASEWVTEATQVADGSPTPAQPSIPTVLGDSFVPYSFQVGMDAPDLLDELSKILIDSAENLMAVGYTTGSGSDEPEGLVTGLVGTASEINTQGSEALAATDPFDLQNALGARFSANATWQAHVATMNGYRAFETTGGSHEFPELRERPASLLGKPFFENSNMDGTIDAAATANNYAMIYGDIAEAFFIVDRIGATLEVIPNLFGANGRPTAQRGALLWFRIGSEVVNVPAARLLDVPTAA